jgi:DNA repair protein RadC
VLFLNSAKKVIGAHIAFVGSLSAIGAITPREVFKAAIVANAAAIVIGHYVARHIMHLLWPDPLCARDAVDALARPRAASFSGT